MITNSSVQTNKSTFDDPTNGHGLKPSGISHVRHLPLNWPRHLKRQRQGFYHDSKADFMNGGEKGLQALSLIAIVILSIVTIDLLNEPEQ